MNLSRSLLLLGFLASLAAALVSGSGPELRWYRGNTHTHTLWSDGDGAPELVVDGYVRSGYHFLALTDHNLLSEGERWFQVAREGDLEQRLTQRRVTELQERFGEDSVRTRPQGERTEMRLATLDELRTRFERPGEFLLVSGEEISASAARLPVHVNALNLVEAIYPPNAQDVASTLNAIVDATQEQAARTGRPILAHVNHPNFRWGITWQELATVAGERFFEVYNGHPSVHNEGDAEHPSLEEMWDRALTLRLTELGLGLLYGLATDDSHQYHAFGLGQVNSGRGWVVVRAHALEAGALIEAMRRGDFYASSGVRLKDVVHDAMGLAFEIEAEPGVEYTTRFVGTRRGAAAEGDEVGLVLAEQRGSSPRYDFRGDELYVRAVVVSDRLHPNPYAEGDLEMAWVQPVRPR